MKYYCSTKTPRNLFDDEQLEAFYNTTSSIFKGCEYVMQEIINSWTDADEYSWCMPDGHWVVVRPRIVEEVEIIWHGCEFTYDFPKQAATGNHRHLPANVVHSVDAYVAREMVRRCDFEMVTNHDCYSSHPNYWKYVCETYREIVAEIAEGNLLQDILRQIRKDKSYEFKKLSNDLPDLIRASEYALS